MSHLHRNVTALEQGWRFRFADEAWQDVVLPHTWNALDTMRLDPAEHYRRGRGTYILDFVPPHDSEGKRLWLEFGAVAQRGWVYFDDVLIAEHHGGYTAFTVEIPNRAGQLRVVADNSPDPDLIPSDLSDFFLYGGITRPVYLYTTGANRIDHLLVDLDVIAQQAQVRLRGRLYERNHAPLSLHIVLSDQHASAIVFEQTQTLKAHSWRLQLPDINEPRLWSPEAPYLYHLSVQLLQDNQLLDEYCTYLGFRWFDFVEYGPFHLNGQRLLLRGTHRHDDWAGHGAAVPHHLIEQELLLIKQAGFNFIRLGHYPQDDYTLHLCDQLGLIVWEELPWCRGGIGGETFQQHARTMLREMIMQHYNNPSVVFWGLGNELDWESEHPDSTDQAVAGFLQELHNSAKALDPHRLTALRRFEIGAEIVDVYSPSIWSGWYRGLYEDYEAVLRQAIQRYPRMLHIEWGGDSHVGRHNDGPHIQTNVASDDDHGEVPGTATSQKGFARYSRDGDWSESYIIALMSHHLTVQSQIPEFAGSAQWIFKDFGTPLRPENPIPFVNQKGLLRRDGQPKDVYYVFKAFQVDQPQIHIESSAWPTRIVSPSGKTCIRVITNCDSAELFINGISYGCQSRQKSSTPAELLLWEVTLSPGMHTIEAVGINRGTAVTHHEIKQAVILGDEGPPVDAALTLKTEPDGLYLEVQLLGADGHPVGGHERWVRFVSADMVRDQGYMGGSAIVHTANGRAWCKLAHDTNLPSLEDVQVEFTSTTVDVICRSKNRPV